MSYFNQSVFRKPKTLVTTHTSVQETSNSAATFVTILGSEISYTPAQNSTKVVYEISFYVEKINGVTFKEVQLQESSDSGSSWAEINSKFKKNFGNGGSSSQANRWNIHFRYVLPAWSGEKHLRLRTSSNTNSRSAKLHQMSEWDGSSATDQFCDTNLLVYSI